jgi:GMP synthase-like glutamine amidotransferase
MNNVIAIINDPDVTLGTIPSSVKTLNAWEVSWENLDLTNTYIILGGHMGSYDDSEYEYLKPEKKWLKSAVQNNTKILGICLGAQLLSDALGGNAYLADNIEFGFKSLNFETDMEKFSEFTDVKVFTWHRDTFLIPPACTKAKPPDPSPSAAPCRCITTRSFGSGFCSFLVPA